MRKVWNLFQRHPIVTFILAAGCLIGLVLTMRALEPSTDPRLTAIRAAGQPMTLAELNAWYPEVPETDNAAVLYAQAFTLSVFGSQVELPETIAEIPTAGFAPLTEESRAKLRSFFEEHSEAMDLLYAATNRAGCRFALDFTQGQFMLLPHLSQLKKACLMLAGAALLHASEGNTRQAANDFAAAARVANSVAGEPLLISQLVRPGCWSVILKGLESTLSLFQFSEEDLELIQSSLAQAEIPDGIARGLAGERTMGLAIFIDPRIQNSFFTGGTGAAPPGSQRSLSSLGSRFGISVLKVSGLFRQDRDFFLDTTSNMIAVAQMPFPDRLKAGQVSTVPPSRLLLFSRMLLPALSRAVTRDADFCARVRTAQTALAVERYRQTHDDRLPERLEALMPQYLPQVPADPYNGQPMRLKRLARGFLIYSVGVNGVDDGGTVEDPKAPKDTVFKIDR